MSILLYVDGVQQQFETKRLVAKLYFEVADLFSKLIDTNGTTNLLQLLKSKDITLQLKDDGTPDLSKLEASADLLQEMITINQKANSFETQKTNYDIYCQILDLVLDTDIEIDWNEQEISEVETYLIQFRKNFK